MTDERWDDVKENIRQAFGIDEETKEDDLIEDDLGNAVKGEKETLIFTNSLGKIRLERIVRPLILEKKMHYHKGAGGTAKVEFILSKDEFSRTLKASLYDEDLNDWKELDLPGGQLTF